MLKWKGANMNSSNIVIRCPRGTDRREVPLDQIQVPDLWHVARYLEAKHEKRAADAVLECWHLAHDLLLNLKGEVGDGAQRSDQEDPEGN